MKSYRLTPATEDDLFDIWSYIAPDNLDSADRLELSWKSSHVPAISGSA